MNGSNQRDHAVNTVQSSRMLKEGPRCMLTRIHEVLGVEGRPARADAYLIVASWRKRLELLHDDLLATTHSAAPMPHVLEQPVLCG